jgi:hypothetical protein
MPNHRQVIKFLIAAIILVVVGWSVVNVSDYAHTFHASWVVWTMGLALGTANALSVYSFVMAKTERVKTPSVVGIVLFGGMSGILQTLLYLQIGAPLLAALAFGWFGPVAEAVLAWLHAALSEEPVKVAGKPAVKTVKADGQAVKLVSLPDVVKPVDQPDQHQLTSLLEMVKLGNVEIAELTGFSRQSIYEWRKGGKLETKLMEKLPQLAAVSTNGHNGHNGF